MFVCSVSYAFLSALFYIICSLLAYACEMPGDQIADAQSSCISSVADGRCDLFLLCSDRRLSAFALIE